MTKDVVSDSVSKVDFTFICALRSRIAQLIFLVYTNIIKHCNCKPSDFWLSLISYYISVTHKENRWKQLQHSKAPVFSLLAGMSSHGIYDSWFHCLLDLTRRHTAIATPGSEVPFTGTGTFSRRVGSDLGKGGHRVACWQSWQWWMPRFDSHLLYFLQSFYS